MKNNQITESYRVNNNKLEFEKFKDCFQELENKKAESIFDEIFSENMLNKISRAFFRFKMESVL